MPSMLAESISNLRIYRDVLQREGMEPDVKAFYEERAKREEDYICFCRSSKPAMVLEVKGLYYETVFYRDAEALAEDIEDWRTEDYEGVSFTVKFVSMTGRQFGKMPVFEP